MYRSGRARRQPERRRLPREPAGWLGRYMVVGRPELGWGECRVLDVSSAGVGLELFGPWPRDGIDAELRVCLEPGTDPDDEGVQLPATVRNASAGRFGFLRVGIEFVGLDAGQREFLASFVGRQPV
ncbi:MAG TPA: PilZ domain-containing protein [Acidimicrobiia bacterium]|nr:PilZ domain-containing protein [Acidimicrobiia bacterium]